MKEEKIICGIDPGTNILGYAFLSVKGKKLELLSLGTLNLKDYADHYMKLKNIYQSISRLMIEFKPDEMALEAPFFGKNVQSMLKLGRAQGVAMAAALNLDIPISEYAPLKVKQSITGSGASSKVHVAYILQKILKIDDLPKNLDASDALAVAICHYYASSSPMQSLGHAKSWADFAQKNPNRVKK